MAPTPALDAVRIFAVLAAATALIVLASRRIGVPEELGLLAAGLVAAIVFRQRIVVTPELVLVVLLPGLVFEAAYRLRLEELRRSLWAALLLAIPGVLISAVAVAVVLSYGVGMAFPLAFLVGAMVSATDPASVVATFTRLRAPRGLATVVQAESLLNDGTGLVLFAVALGFVGGTASIGSAALQVAASIAGSAVIGIVLGVVASRIIAMVDDFVVEITVSIALAYGSYLAADAVHASGVIATVVAGVVLGNYGHRVAMSQRTRDAVDIVWSTAGFLLTALVFLLMGMAIQLDALPAAGAAIAWGSLAVLLGRAVVVYGLLGAAGGALAIFGRGGIPLRWRHVVFWSGLRGAVAVAMALSLPSDLPDRQVLQEAVFGIVLFTLLVQGTTASTFTRAVIRPVQ